MLYFYRLDISKSPDVILSQLSNICFVGIQMCPRMNNMFIYAGSGCPSSPESTDSSCGWAVSKVLSFSNNHIRGFRTILFCLLI